MLWLTRQSLKRPPITIMLSLVIIIVGLVASRSLKQELFPDISFPVVSVTTIYPGASAEVLDQEVTSVIEKAVSGLPGVEAVQSSSSESFAFTVVQFDVSADVKEAKANVQEKLSSLTLPEGAQAPTIGTFDFNSLPILSASVSGDDLTAIQSELEERVLPAVSALPGVSNVSITGGTQDKILIMLNPEKLAEYGVTQCSVVQLLQANNLAIPVGNITDNGSSLPLRVTSTYSSTDAIKNLVVGVKGGFGGGSSLGGGGSFGGSGGLNSCIAAIGAPSATATTAPSPTVAAPTTTPITPSAVVTTSLIPELLQAQGITSPEQLTPAAINAFPEAGLAVIDLPLALALSDESQAALAARLPEPEIGEQLAAAGITSPEQITPELIAQFPAPALSLFPVNLALALPEASQTALGAALAQAAPAATATPAAGAPQLPKEFAAFGITSPEQITPELIAQVPAQYLEVFTPELTALLSPEAQAALEERKANPDAAAGLPEDLLVRLGDVASVEVGTVGGTTITRTNGEPSIGIDIFRDSTGNTVDIVDSVRDEFAAIEAETKASATPLTFKIVREQATPVLESIGAVTSEGLIGAVVAIIVIFLFLRSVRSTLVTAVSIPLSVVVALVLIRLQGFSLNVMTLGGLTVAVGRVVDDAIVVLENIYRHINRGESRGKAVIEGTREVAGAITASTLTTVCVFLPLGVVGGIVSKFFLPFALTVTYALLASLLVSLTVVPLLARMFIRPDAKQSDERETLLQRLYTPALRWSLRSAGTKIATLAIAVLLFFGSLALAGQLKFTFLPDNSDKNISIALQMPEGTALENTDAQTSAVEELLKPYKDDGRVRDIQTIIGSAGNGQSSDRTGGRTAGNRSRLTLTLDNSKVTDLVGMINEIEAKIKGLNTFDTVVVQAVASDGGGPAGSGLDIVLVSSDVEKLREANTKILDAFGGNKSIEKYSVANVSSSLAEVKPELKVTVDPELAIASGLTTFQVAGQVWAQLNGERAGAATLAGMDSPLDLYVQLDQTSLTVEQLRKLPINGLLGATMLEKVAAVDVVDGATTISRINGDRAASLSGQFTTDDTINAQANFEQAVIDLGLPEGVSVQAGAQAQSQTETLSDMGLALLVAIVLVYVVMVLTFGSLSTPFIILFTFPLAIIGAILGLYVTGKPLGITSLIGVLMLIGIVVTNAIVLLELVEQYRERGMSIYDALIRAGRVRLRPILMTAIATMVALIPLALGLKKGGFIAADLAVVVIGGLFTSTFLTLVVVPVLYSIFEGIKERMGWSGHHGGSDDDGELTPAPAVVAAAPAQPAAKKRRSSR